VKETVVSMKITWDLVVKKEIEPFSTGIGIIKDVLVVNQAESLSKIKNKVFESIKKKYTIDGIKDTPIVNAYRKFYWKYLNIDPTKTRPSGEALARRVLKNQKIPIISNIVYAINLASVQTQLSYSGFDLDKVKGTLIIRYAKLEERFQGIGTRHRILAGNELLLADAEKILCIYAYGDADATKITSNTKNILLVSYGVPKISSEMLKKGIELGLNYIHEAGGGEIEKIIVTRSAPLEP
jgi:DNA/RNA-binding domain of Phe-tRNA-synthetase-like protein